MGRIPSRDGRLRGLVDAHLADIQAYCLRRLDPDDACDAAADVFLAAWRRIDSAPAGDDARMWLYGIARNVVRNWRRSRRRRLRLAGRLSALAPPAAAGSDVQVVRQTEYQELLAAVARLKPIERELLRLHTWEELRASEIAALTGLSVGAVQTRLSRIRKALARDMGGASARGPAVVQWEEEGG